MYTVPRMSQSPSLEWSNESDQEEPEARSVEECEQKCQSNSNCLQYSFEESSSKCRVRETPKLGVAKVGTRSGWLIDRMRGFRANMPVCGDAHWPT